MRVTENTNFDTVRDSITRSRDRLQNYQLQSSTLRRVNTPSDDPVGAAKVMELRTDKVNNDQFQQNAKNAETFLVNSDHALSEISELLVRAKEIAINQSSGPSSNEESRMGVAEEVSQLFLQAVSTANRRVGERYLFGGYQTTKPPVDSEGNYKGDDGQMMVEVAKDVYITMNVSGNEAFNTNPVPIKPPPVKGQDPDAPMYGPDGRKIASTKARREEEARPKENVNVFGELENLRIGLLAGDMEGIRSTLERLDALHTRVTAIRAKMGSRLAGMQATSQAIEKHNVTNASLSSQIEDADMAHVMSELAKEETVFKSSLNSSRRLIQPMLMDFLK